MKKYLIALGSNLETQNLSRLEVINKAIGYFSQLTSHIWLLINNYLF